MIYDRSFLGAYFDQAITNFPREDSGVIPFVFFNFFLNLGSGDSGLASSNHSRPNAARFLVSVQYLGDTSVGHPKLPWDDAGSYTCSRQFHNFETYMVWKGPSVDKYSTQLVHPSLTYDIKYFSRLKKAGWTRWIGRCWRMRICNRSKQSFFPR